MEDKKYYVEFVPNFSKIGRNRSIARHNGEDEFSLKEAKKVADILKKRGDKVVKIRPA